MVEISPQEAATLVLQRRGIRGSLLKWCRHCGYEPARHHRLLIQKLEDIAARRIDRLAIFMPPGAAKSTYASMLFPAWYLANYPTHDIIGASHTAELAEKFGRRVRNLIQEHANVLDIALSPDTTAAGRWAITAGGNYLAAGAGRAISGYRADLVSIDDPIGSREDADSDTIKDNLWDWFNADIIGRCKPGAGIVLIQTRWAEDDLAGRILESMANGGDKWEVVSLPALAEPDDPLGREVGETLWPEYYTMEEMVRRRDALLLAGKTRDWSALYQQRPAPEEGDFFKADWFKTYKTAPPREQLAVYGASDHAVTSDGGDWTVHVVVGLDPDGRMYLLDMWRKRAASDEWVEAFCALVKEWKPFEWAEETGQIRSGIGPFLERMQRERGAFVYRSQFPTRGDKAIRAQSIRGRMAVGGLYLPQNRPWVADLRHELLTFPAGKNDDIVDALGLVGQLLDRMSVGVRPPAKDKNPGRWSGYRHAKLGGASNDWITY